MLRNTQVKKKNKKFTEILARKHVVKHLTLLKSCDITVVSIASQYNKITSYSAPVFGCDETLTMR